MDTQKLDMFIMTNQKFFPSEKIMYLKERLRDIDDEKFSLISTIELKDPTTILLVSIFRNPWNRSLYDRRYRNGRSKAINRRALRYSYHY